MSKQRITFVTPEQARHYIECVLAGGWNSILPLPLDNLKKRALRNAKKENERRALHLGLIGRWEAGAYPKGTSLVHDKVANVWGLRYRNVAPVSAKAYNPLALSIKAGYRIASPLAASTGVPYGKQQGKAVTKEDSTLLTRRKVRARVCHNHMGSTPKQFVKKG
jgi:hypothetical protein